MTTHHVSGTRDFVCALDVGVAGDRYILHAAEYDGLDSYTQRVKGGSSWGTRTRIEAYQRSGQPRDKVVFRPAGVQFGIHLAHALNGYLQIGTPDAPIEVDATNVTEDGVKVTSASGDAGARYVGLYVHVHHAPHQGVLATVPNVYLLGGSSRHNGWTTDPQWLNKYHGVYLGAGAWDCKVVDFDTSDNAAYGVHEYGGEAPGLVGRNLILRGFHVANGRLAPRAGILLSGTGSTAERVMSTRNQLGIHVYRTARGCAYGGYLEGNTDGPSYIDPAAVGTIALDSL